MTKKQLLFATAALTAVALTDTTAHADADNNTAAPVATQQVAADSQTATSTTADSQAVSSQAATSQAASSQAATSQAVSSQAATSEATQSTSASSQSAASKSAASSQAVKSQAAKSTSAAATSATAQSTSVSASKTAPTVKKAASSQKITKSMTKDQVAEVAGDRFDAIDNPFTNWLMGQTDPIATLDNMTDAQYEAFMVKYYDAMVDLENELGDYIAANGSNAELDDLMDFISDYLDDFEDLLSEDEDEDEDIDEMAATNGGQAKGTSVNPNAIGASDKTATDAQTRMAKYHGADAKTLPNTGSDAQNGLAIAGAAMLAGLGALGFGYKKRS
ncbi:LPXTG-motif cell wall-anchored protein [Weissella uvarum]|uniref:LPXTG cell wall anchor domain-containing protein n=1 Tax=Weissella uvarum TaxID=1479233 RepID=UPI001960CC94|nr:LPXTG cell wall anchor domain-containing protein [Weissella uvarum]MBM7617165.1 LPXTG-motif cell wall-anchored protein [Weissella uvarum]MCM0595461.1 LPXTG cell wall anchor domain-containing protein [Weissella uvarum]